MASTATTGPPTASSELTDFVDFCADLVLDTGENMVLHEFQQTMLSDFFAGTTETLVLIPKKNSKSTTLAALALFHLVDRVDAECVIAAASRDQATILYDQAAGFVRRSPVLQRFVDVRRGFREIRAKADSGRIRVLASDVDTADGVIPTLALVDELHRHRSADLYGVFRDGLGPRQGRMITISTAGDNEDSPLGRLRAAAHAMPGLERDGQHWHVTSQEFALHEWALTPEQDRDDLDLVTLANPAPWQDKEALRRRKDSPSMTAWQWARFACGVWGLGSKPAFDLEVWNALAKPGVGIDPGRTVALGFDGSRRWDATGIVATDIETGHQVLVGAWERPPGAFDDWEVPEDEVNEAVSYAFDRWDVWRMYADPPYWESALDRWAGEYGAECVVRWWTNRLKQMALSLAAWQTDMQTGVVSHDGDPLLARHIGNAVVHETRMRDGDRELWVIRKDSPKSPRKIDAAMAACLSWEARGDAIRAGVLNKPNHGRATW